MSLWDLLLDLGLMKVAERGIMPEDPAISAYRMVEAYLQEEVNVNQGRFLMHNKKIQSLTWFYKIPV